VVINLVEDTEPASSIHAFTEPFVVRGINHLFET